MELRLRPRTDADLAWEWHWQHERRDPEWKRWDAPYFHVEDEHLSYAGFAARASAPTPHRRLLERNGEPAGFVTRWEEEPADGGWWELGIVIYDPAHWGGGLGTSTLRLWTERTFAETDAHSSRSPHGAATSAWSARPHASATPNARASRRPGCGGAAATTA